jgi:hypothetical protein
MLELLISLCFMDLTMDFLKKNRRIFEFFGA